MVFTQVKFCCVSHRIYGNQCNVYAYINLGNPKNDKEKFIINQYYGQLCKGVTDVANWSPYCVAKGLISSDFSLKLQSIKSFSEQAEMLLQCITGPVEAGNVKVLYVLLDIMEQHGVSATKQLATEIKDRLNAKVSLLHIYVLPHMCDSLSEPSLATFHLTVF